MEKINLTLKTKILLLALVIVAISMTTSTYLLTKWIVYDIQQRVETNMLNMAKTIANDPTVKRELAIKDPNHVINKYVTTILQRLEEVEIIVVADTEGIRYAHPNPERIGEKFVGGDEARVIQHGDTYISQSVGTLGRSIRAFVPIYNVDNEQIGFVMVGTLVKSIKNTKEHAILTVVLLSGIGLALGSLGAYLLSRNIKNTLLGLEPNEITKLYNERQAMLDTLQEGIIAIDKNKKISLINRTALKMLKINQWKESILGKDIDTIFPDSRLVKILDNGKPEYHYELNINDIIVVANAVPIIDGGHIVGSMATFQDKTLVVKLAEEITGVRQIVEGLRANNHEFLNKLHVISGLIQIGELEEVKKYIVTISEAQQQIINLIIKKIEDPLIAGLVIGKYSRGKEMGIDLIINSQTNMYKEHERISRSTLVTVIGNILDNALEAVRRSDKKRKEVCLLIQETSKHIHIHIQDNGVGIPEKDMNKIFNKGYSTKENSKGVGLALVKEVVDNLGGKIKVNSQIKKGTEMIIELYKNHITY